MEAEHNMPTGHAIQYKMKTIVACTTIYWNKGSDQDISYWTSQQINPQLFRNDGPITTWSKQPDFPLKTSVDIFDFLYQDN